MPRCSGGQATNRLVGSYEEVLIADKMVGEPLG